MYTKTDLKKQLEKMKIQQSGTLLVHSSFKSMGEVAGGPATVLESLAEYMEEGLLVFPTHTWAHIKKENPYFYVDKTPTNVGILTELFRQREDVVRSWHPTHSVGALGKDAESFTQGDERFDTPCARPSVWGKLLDRKAQIMLVGVDLRRNTFIHGIEEWLDIPNRLTDTHEQLYTILPDGTTLSVPSRRHTASWSENFAKVDEVLQSLGAMYLGQFGDAEVRICDTVKLTNILTRMLQYDPELFSDEEPLRAESREYFLTFNQ